MRQHFINITAKKNKNKNFKTAAKALEIIEKRVYQSMS
jgi:hypothetical protein